MADVNVCILACTSLIHDCYWSRLKHMLWLLCLMLQIHLLSLSQDEALRTGVAAGLLVVVQEVGAGCSGRAGQALDSLSSLGSGMLPMPVEALPTEWFRL